MKQVRSIVLILLICALCLSLPGGLAAAEELNAPLFVCDLPAGVTEPCEQAGTVTEEHYLTYRYNLDGERGQPLVGTLYVYTPYGYDPQKQYDILYLMHGGGEIAAYWFGLGIYAQGGPRYEPQHASRAVNLLDQRIAAGECPEMIVVTPSFMHQFDEGHNLYTLGTVAWLETFAYEFQNDILPFVETKYSTYARRDPSEENLIASRAHRAYAGFSMGSFTGFQAIWMHCLPYVGYIGNFSGCDTQDTGIAARVADTINELGDAYPVLYWYNGNGSEDSLHNEHLAAYWRILAACPDYLREGEDLSAGDNAFFVDKPGKKHQFSNWIVDLYNITSVFFQVPGADAQAVPVVPHWRSR